MPAHKQGKKTRKYGRKIKKPAQKRYTSEERWIKNKATKIIKHIKKHPKNVPTNMTDKVKTIVNKYLRSA